TEAHTVPAEALAAAGLLGQVMPPSSGLVRTWAAPDATAASSLLASKILNPGEVREDGFPGLDYYYPGARDGEADWEVRIDEPPVESNGRPFDATALRTLFEASGVLAMGAAQSHQTQPGSSFLMTPAAVALS